MALAGDSVVDAVVTVIAGSEIFGKINSATQPYIITKSQNPMQLRAPSGRISDIEVLRAFAILITLANHFRTLFPWKSDKLDWFYSHFALWGGVDLFFAVSGFVICKDLWVELGTTQPKESYWARAIAFWIRRAYRILPSSWAWLALGVVATIGFNRSGSFGRLGPTVFDIAAVVSQVMNLRLWSCFHGINICGMNTVYWSLSLEEQFYIIFPIALYFINRRLAGLLLVLFIVQILIPRPPYVFIWFIRTDALFFGVLLAFAMRSSLYSLFEPKFLEKTPARATVVSALIGVIVLVPGLSLQNKAEVVPLATGVLAIACGLFVGIASYDKNYILRSRFMRPVMLWIGARSYAIYLIHLPAYYATTEIWFRLMPKGAIFDGSYTARFAITALLLIVLFSELNYRFIETPLRRRGRKISQQFVEKYRVQQSLS